jgi:hypothetical protein
MSIPLLIESNRLEGPHSVAATVRPRRVAYLVDPSDAAIALAVIEAACLEWGGRFHFLIPCAPGGAPEPVWAGILDKHDPDVIVDLIGAHRAYLAVHTEKWGRWVYRWERPLETMLLVGPVVYGALRQWKAMRSPHQTYTTWHLTPLRGHPLALPIGFQLGHIDRRPMDQNTDVYQSYQSALHRDFLNVVETDPRTLPDEQLAIAAAVSNFSPGSLLARLVLDRTSGHHNHYALPGLTRQNIAVAEPSYILGGRVDPEYEQHDEAYLRRLVVIGAPDSVPDLCLAWNLRAQRDKTLPFPLWIAPEWLSEPSFLPGIQMALQVGQGGMLEEGPRATELHLVSATVETARFAGAFGNLPGPVIGHDGTPLDRFFTSAFRFGLTKEMSVLFQKGVADLALPDHREVGSFYAEERIGYTVTIKGYAAPPGSHEYFPRAGQIPSRVAHDGITGFIHAFHTPDKPVRVGTNDGLQLVKGAASQAGYEARMSMPGQRAIAVMSIFGEAAGLDVLASSRVYKVLVGMAETVLRQAIQRVRRDASPEEQVVIEARIDPGQFERLHRTWGQLKGDLGPGVPEVASRAIVAWLADRRILLRGYRVKCGTCHEERWYPLSKLGGDERCDACRSVLPPPGDVNGLQWVYRLNDAVARAHDQGVLPHLLAVRRMGVWNNSGDRDYLGVLPGVELTLREEGVKANEVDLFAIKAGRVIIGECKVTGSQLKEAEVEDFAALSRRFDCSRIIYATPTDFDDIPEIIERARILSAPAEVETWQHDDLLDFDLRYGPRSAPVYLAKVAERLSPT